MKMSNILLYLSYPKSIQEEKINIYSYYSRLIAIRRAHELGPITGLLPFLLSFFPKISSLMFFLPVLCPFFLFFFLFWRLFKICYSILFLNFRSLISPSSRSSSSCVSFIQMDFNLLVW